MNEKGSKTGVVFAVIILLIVSMGLYLALDFPQTSSFSLPPAPSVVPHTANITLWADASGWDYNHGTVNPTITILNGTLVHFTIIEEDGQPHTFTINPGPTESTVFDTLLSISQITTTPGSVSHANAYFPKVGVYTYWCTVHPTTMVGLIYVNSSLPSHVYTFPKPPANMSANHNTSLTSTNNGFIGPTGKLNPSLFYQNGSLVEFHIKQNGTSNHSFVIAPGNVESSYNATIINASQMGNINGNVATAQVYFDKLGEYTYWDSYFPSSTEGHIFVVSHNISLSITALKNGLEFNGSLNWTIPAMNGTELIFNVADAGHYNYSIIFLNASHSAVAYIQNTTNSSGVSEFAFYGYSAFSVKYNATSSINRDSILYYNYLENITLYADANGWNYSKGAVNPVFNVTVGTLVKFDLVNVDGLYHELLINPGANESLQNSTMVAEVNNTIHSSTGYYLFDTVSVYTYWDAFHPYTAVSTINVTNSTSSTSSTSVSVNSLVLVNHTVISAGVTEGQNNELERFFKNF